VQLAGAIAVEEFGEVVGKVDGGSVEGATTDNRFGVEMFSLSRHVMMVYRESCLLGKRSTVRSSAGKSPLYLMENLSGGQLPPVLWRWSVAFCLQKSRRR
jgi:hypothetical protein